jgi:hypothetical protein
MEPELHSTRLFPKNLGTQAYRLTGIAARCDWVVLSDRAEPAVQLVRRLPTPAPRHIFLSLRSPFAALDYLAHHVLPQVQAPFVLVSGSEDVTVPNQRDLRWPAFGADDRRHIDAILKHPQLRHWFAENLDDASHPLMSPLPVGLVFPDGRPPAGLAAPAVRPLSERPLRALCAHRTRPGPQWDVRRQVSALATGHWAEWCTVVDHEVPEPEFLALAEQHAFVLCVEGGGLDPSPKAWQSLLHGAIPIVRDSPLRQAYAQLPVAFVQDWTADELGPAQLRQWRDAMATFQDEPQKRQETLRRLSLDHWWSQIARHARLQP